MRSWWLVSMDTLCSKSPVVAVELVGLAWVSTQRNVSLRPL